MTLDGSFAISQGLGDDYRHELHTIKVSADVYSICLISLIYRHHSNSCFKVIRERGLVGMIMRLTYIV